jgi:hypothetical protein
MKVNKLLGVVEDGAVLDRAGSRGGGGRSSGQGGARPGAVKNGVAAGVVLGRGSCHTVIRATRVINEREQRRRVDLKIYGCGDSRGGRGVGD